MHLHIYACAVLHVFFVCEKQACSNYFIDDDNHCLTDVTRSKKFGHRRQYYTFDETVFRTEKHT